MKNINLLKVAFFLALIAFGSCNKFNKATTDSESTVISTEEKEIIKKEISERIEEIIKGANTLDVEAAIKPYSNEADFRIVNPDATVTDFQTMKTTQVEAFKTLASMNFKTIKQDFIFLTKNTVICTWTGSNDFELKSGEKMKIDPYVGTLIFRKKNNEWKIIYAQESTAPPILLETKKK
jgi:hypothetical protein